MDTNFFNTRKTVRSYSGKPIDPKLMSQMIEAAACAPTTGGMQLYSVVVTTDENVKQQLAPCHFNQPMVTEAPAVLTFCADFNRFCKWCHQSNATPGFNNFESFVSALLDATVFAQQFNTIAELNGLGCCYIGTTTYNAKAIAEVLSLPQMVIPVVTITVGYPSDESDNQPKAERLPVGAIMHAEKYTDYATDDISEIYREKEAMEVNKQFVKENGKETLAQVFTDIRYPKETSETFSRLYYDFIASQGFEFPK